jgi:hypothetical protein
MFDVLEHLDDDAGAVRWAASVLEPGGIFALTVPAHPFLYDEMDRLAFHRRRYTRAVLGDLLATAGFEIRVLTYVMSLLVPLLLLVRGVGSLLAPIWTPAARRGAELRAHPIANKVLLAALRRERRLRSGRDLPFGLSLLAVAARPVATAAGDGSGRR